MKDLSFIPLNDRLVVKPDKAPKKIGSIHLPDTDKKPTSGVVVAVSSKEVEVTQGQTSGFKEYALEPALQLKAGEQVFFSQFSGVPITLSGEEYVILKADELLGVMR